MLTGFICLQRVNNEFSGCVTHNLFVPGSSRYVLLVPGLYVSKYCYPDLPVYEAIVLTKKNHSPHFTRITVSCKKKQRNLLQPLNPSLSMELQLLTLVMFGAKWRIIVKAKTEEL